MYNFVFSGLYFSFSGIVLLSSVVDKRVCMQVSTRRQTHGLPRCLFDCAIGCLSFCLVGAARAHPLKAQPLKNIGHFLFGLYLGRHKRQSQLVFDEPHIVEQCFDTGWIAVDK